jgi:CheY-like chemotaxis protein
MTADVQDSTRARLLGLGATEVINKPLTTEKLMGAVARALADAAGGRP